ncbi:tetratricopeptide repeat protein [Phaeobacter sp. 22II1-1F12B]|uniref:tetratricopeptide repeat protein n=1 Tax=Phaeobacter sp. 22II1-1F12B TaxID=1317111 RepID=UPI001E482476|nr:tetratricopeptide repeat protein [Phaeobacter sp. 22II1-1F12B]
MKVTGVMSSTPIRAFLAGTILVAMVAACGPERIEITEDTPYAPGTDPKGEAVDGVEVGNRLISAGQYELALDAFTRAALEQGMTPEILSGFGSANLGLGRLGQAEELMRRSVKEAPDWPEAWNNLGVVLMEKGETAEAEQVFRKAYALDNGQSDSIRDNLRLALAKTEVSVHTETQNEDFKLVQRGEGDFLLRKN